MPRVQLILATLICTLSPAILHAQGELSSDVTPTASEVVFQNPDSSVAGSAQAGSPATRNHRRVYFASARRHPITPREVSMRVAIESLGVDKHRFVRCELQDGSHLVGGVTGIHFATFTISQGINTTRQIKYSDLKQPPEPVPAVGEHFVNGLKWTGVVAGCVALSPIIIALLPLMYAGVLND